MYEEIILCGGENYMKIDKDECQVLIVINVKTMNQQQEKENDANHPAQSTTTIYNILDIISHHTT